MLSKILKKLIYGVSTNPLFGEYSKREIVVSDKKFISFWCYWTYLSRHWIEGGHPSQYFMYASLEKKHN